MKSQATNVEDYLASLPEDRRAGIEAVREVILGNLDKDYEECMLWGMIGYAVPHRVWPLGYHCDPKKPLMMAALASQKNNMTVYLMSVYEDKATREWFQKAWARTGKRLNMGGCCIHFKKLEDAALDVIGEAIRRTPARAYVENYVKTLASTGRGPDGKKLKGEKTAKVTVKTTAKATVKTTAKATADTSVKKTATKTAKATATKTAKATAKKTTKAPATRTAKATATKATKATATKATKKTATKATKKTATKTTKTPATRTAKAPAKKTAKR